MDRHDWDARYEGREFLWDVAPNVFVERYLADLPPGSAIDLAAGEGRNAIWLAARGWKVTAVDFSEVALAKARRLATDRGVSDRVELVVADALTYQPEASVDLVVVAYFQVSPDEQRTVLEHAAAWLRPGGAIFVVAHDRANVDHGWGGPSSIEHCYDLRATTAALAGLEIEHAETMERTVDTDDGPRTALDSVIIATRPRS